MRVVPDDQNLNRKSNIASVKTTWEACLLSSDEKNVYLCCFSD